MKQNNNLRSNGSFSILREPFDKVQHQNQQSGLDRYVVVIDHYTGRENEVKLYKNTKGLHFKKDGTHYLKDFTQLYTYIPFQMIKE